MKKRYVWVALLTFAGAMSVATRAQTPPPGPVPTPSPLASPTPTPAPEPTPSPFPTAGGSPSPSASPSVSPSPSPTPLPTPVVLPPDAMPQIVDLKLNTTELHAGDILSGTAITSTNVASLEVRIASYSISVPRTDFGVFALSYEVPRTPFFAHHKWTAHVIARNARGDQAQRDITVTLR